MRKIIKRINPVSRQGLIYSVLLALLILGMGGIGFWIIDPKVHTLGDGLWLAFTTAATVGYGDIVPHTSASRMFAVLVVLLGLGVLSLVTASVAALFVQTEDRKVERQLLQSLRELNTRVAHMEHTLARIALHQVVDGASTTSAAERKASTADGTPQ